MTDPVGSAADPVCLDDDSSVEDSKEKRGNAVLKGRLKKDDKASVKRQRVSVDNSKAPEAPIKLFTTDLDQQKHRAAGGSTASYRHHHRTLRQMLELDGDGSRAIKWIAIFNYLIDFEWLLQELPELLSCPQTLVFYGSDYSPPDGWKQACTKPDGTCTAHFKQTVPSDPPRSATNPLSYKIPYGVHHTKMFLIGFSDGTLRVIIHTANLIQGDLHINAQGAYIQDFPLKQNPYQGTCDFEQDLLSYLDSYQYQQTHPWDGEKRTLTNELRRYDFSSARVVLIPSTPGRHSIIKGTPIGHLKLRKAIQEHASSQISDRPVVCQFSSLGAQLKKWVGEKFLPACRPHDSSSDTRPLGDKIKFVYPTSEDIRCSVAGYCGGGSVPGRHKNVSQDFLRPLLCKWASSSSTNPFEKGRNIPHIKTFYQIGQDNASMDWFVLTSHNVSKAAWGEVQNSQYGQRVNFVRHWELGVFISPQLLCGDAETERRLVPVGMGGEQDIRIPLPFEFVPESYGENDKPWACDVRYEIPDMFGRFGGM